MESIRLCFTFTLVSFFSVNYFWRLWRDIRDLVINFPWILSFIPIS